MLALAVLGASLAFADAFGASMLDPLIDPPDLESLSWSDGVITGLLGDRRERRDEFVALRSRSNSQVVVPDPAPVDQIVFDEESSFGLNPVGYANLIQNPLVDDSVPDLAESDSVSIGSLTDCALRGDGIFRCDLR